MTRLRARLLKPDDRYDVDPGSRRGLLGSLIQVGLYVVLFGTLFGLAVVTGTIEPGVTRRPVWVAVAAALGGGTIGGGMVPLARVAPIGRAWRTVAGRLLTVLGVVAAFWVLLAVIGVDAVLAAGGFVVGRLLAVVWRFLRT